MIMVFSRTNFQAKNLAEAMKLADFLHDLRQRITKFEIRQAFLRKPYKNDHGFLKIREGTAKLAKSAKKKQET